MQPRKFKFCTKMQPHTSDFCTKKQPRKRKFRTKKQVRGVLSRPKSLFGAFQFSQKRSKYIFTLPWLYDIIYNNYNSSNNTRVCAPCAGAKT